MSAAVTLPLNAAMKPRRDDGDDLARRDHPHGQRPAAMKPRRDDGDDMALDVGTLVGYLPQ